jgi:hypothetical protein
LKLFLNFLSLSRLLWLQTLPINHGEGKQEGKKDQKAIEGREKDSITTRITARKETRLENSIENLHNFQTFSHQLNVFKLFEIFLMEIFCSKR